MSSRFQRTVLCTQSRPSWVICTVAVPECSAEAAVRIAAFLTAAAAFSTLGVTPDEPTVSKTATATAAARATPAVTPTRRRRGRRWRSRGSPVDSAVAIRKRTAAAAASTASLKLALLRGLALRKASRLCDVLMILLPVRLWFSSIRVRDGPCGDRRGCAAASLAVLGCGEFLQGRAEAATGTVEPTSRGHLRAVQNRGDLRG